MNRERQRLLVKTGKHYIPVKLETIAMVISKSPFAAIRTFAGNEYLTSYSVESLYALLPPKHFFRINRQVVINYEAIRKVQVLSNDKLLILPHTESPMDLFVPRERTEAFKNWMNS